MSQSDDPGRPGAQPHGQHPYGDPYAPQHPAPAAYGQHPYPPQHGGPAGPPQPYGAYGTSAAPARPGGVVTAAVLGFVFGAFGVLITFFLLLAGAAATTAGDDIDQGIPGFGSMAGAIGGALLVVGVLALVWTVVMIWGSVRALTGRSRVLLLVGGWVAVGLAVLGLTGSLLAGGAGDVVANLLFLLAAAAVVVPLHTRSAAQFFAAHRYHRTGR